MVKKWMMALLVCLLVPVMIAAGEHDPYVMIEEALYRVVLRSDEGDVTLGGGVLYGSQDQLLTAEYCCAEGTLYAIGADGEHAVIRCEKLGDSGAALMTLAAPADAVPLQLSDYEADPLPGIIGVTPEGDPGMTMLFQLLEGVYRGRAAMVLSSDEGLTPGAFLADENGGIVALVVAQQVEGLGAYIALEALTLEPLVTGAEPATLQASARWLNGLLEITWEDEKRTGGQYVVSFSGEGNAYYKAFDAEISERKILLDAAPGHTYYYHVQWVESADQGGFNWDSMQPFTIPDTKFAMNGFRQTCTLGWAPAGEKAEEAFVAPPYFTVSALQDAALEKYLQVDIAYTIETAVTLPMTVELIGPDGQFYYEESTCTLSPEWMKEQFYVPVRRMLDSCARFSGGQLCPGEYRLRWAIGGKIAGEYAFTALEEAPADALPLVTAAPAADSGYIAGLQVGASAGLVSIDWSGCGVPEGATVTAYCLYEGNPYFSFCQMVEGETMVEFHGVPGRDSFVWAYWSMGEVKHDIPADLTLIHRVKTAAGDACERFGLQNLRAGLTLTAQTDPESATAFLPAIALTREGLNDPALRLVFQTEDVYNAAEISEMHALHFVLFTPEGYVVTEPGYYTFDPAYAVCDWWVKDLSGLAETYLIYTENGEWAAGEYVFAYCIDGVTVCEIPFTLE